jgi:RNA polymerase sigma-70 factor (ECF subfamily)
MDRGASRRVQEMPSESAITSEPDLPAPPRPEAIFQQEFRYVWSTLRRLGVQDRDLEDVTHEVFVRVYAQLPLYDAARPLRAWLFGIALGMAANYRRLARHRVGLIAEVPDLPDHSNQADVSLERRQQSELVHAALQKVPLEQRAVLVLHELDGYSVPEVALSLGLGLNTAYSRLRLAREAFRSAFRRLANQKRQRS